jgi:phytoene synthase
MTKEALHPDSVTTQSAFERCSEDVRRRARNFWYGLRLLPPERFKALCAIYAWMRRADDLADEEIEGVSPEQRLATLELFRNRTHELFAGTLDDGFTGDEAHIWIAMKQVVKDHELDPADFDSMIDGQVADLTPRSTDGMANLTIYCDQVASTVGRTCVRIWGASSPEALEMASQRGIAFQITNILRDIREDHDRGRVYLPTALLVEHGVDVEMILNWTEPQRCARLVHALTDIARDGYRRSRDLESLLLPDCRPTSWVMTTIYRSLLEKIAHRPHLLGTTNRIRLSSLRKAAIALRARRYAWYGLGERGGVIK